MAAPRHRKPPPVFLLSKILGALVQPGNLAMAALLAGAVLLFTRRQRLGRALVAGAAVAVAVGAVLPLDVWLDGVLEDRFPPLELPAHVDGIVVLGGAVDPLLSAGRGRPAVTTAADRITTLVALAHRYPSARLIYSGGSGDPLAPDATEAPWVRRLLGQMGCDTGRMTFESGSRNTRENALFSRALMRPLPGEVWLLVTSAVHMPRAVGAFRAVGWTVVPDPVDYLTTGEAVPPLRLAPGGLWALGPVAHELAGLAYYRLRGWTDALLPAP